jgi:hypothetical protein
MKGYSPSWLDFPFESFSFPFIIAIAGRSAKQKAESSHPSGWSLECLETASAGKPEEVVPADAVEVHHITGFKIKEGWQTEAASLEPPERSNGDSFIHHGVCLANRHLDAFPRHTFA